MENEANAAAILWASRNPEQGSDPHLHCRLSTGVGGCIMVEGRPWRGHRSLAGEIGHMTVQPFGTLCGCGNRGCLETVAGGKALQGLYAE
ncbi:MAG: ROK family protein, partial [Planctomyces sp.]